MKQGAGDRGGATTYISFPSKIVPNVAACTSVQRLKGGSFSTRSVESVPHAIKSLQNGHLQESCLWVDSGIISGLFVGLDGPGTGGKELQELCAF